MIRPMTCCSGREMLLSKWVKTCGSTHSSAAGQVRSPLPPKSANSSSASAMRAANGRGSGTSRPALSITLFPITRTMRVCFGFSWREKSAVLPTASLKFSIHSRAWVAEKSAPSPATPRGKSGLARPRNWPAGSTGVFTNLNPGGRAAKFSAQNAVPTPDGGMWVEADGKLLLYEHEHWSEPVPDWDGGVEPWSRARSFRSDNVGGLWISLDEAGLVHASPDGRLVRVTSADGLPGQLVQVFFTDSEGNFWAGYHRGGLVLLRKETFHTINASEGLQDRIVTSVTEDKANAIWLGMSSGSVSRWVDGVLTNFSLPLRGGNCQDVVAAAEPTGRVWLGTSGNGLVVWEQNEFRHALLPAQMLQGVVQLLVAKNGEVWFANPVGLYRFDGTKQVRRFATKPSEQVASLTQEADGTIWFGTFGYDRKSKS